MTEKVYIRKNHDRRLKSGHLWIFSNEIQALPKLKPGTVVEVFNSKEESLGFGFYNPNSLISVRLLNYLNEPDKKFFVDRFQDALSYRHLLFPEENAYRLVYGESDFLPGLIIDKYEDYFVLQILSAGMEAIKSIMTEALLEVFPKTKGIIQKNNSFHRELEGLKTEDEILFGDVPENIIIYENGVKISVSVQTGQKTGYFFDQRINRLEVRKFAKGKSVLDCFSNLSGFALNAAIGSAVSVTTVDSSRNAIDNSEINFKLNNIVNYELICDDAFDFLKKSITENRKWDLIILDPPAFTKSKKNVDSAIKGYSRLNSLGMQSLNEDGLLATSSCSQHIPEEWFFELISREASKLGKQLKVIYRGSQSPDHPVLASMPETKYLKFFIFKIF